MSWRLSWQRSRGSRTSCTGSANQELSLHFKFFGLKKYFLIIASCRYVRELEQQNDDLERAKRSTLARWRMFPIDTSSSYKWIEENLLQLKDPQLGRFRGENERCYWEKCLFGVGTRREGWRKKLSFLNIFDAGELEDGGAEVERRDQGPEVWVESAQPSSGEMLLFCFQF